MWNVNLFAAKHDCISVVGRRTALNRFHYITDRQSSAIMSTLNAVLAWRDAKCRPSFRRNVWKIKVKFNDWIKSSNRWSRLGCDSRKKRHHSRTEEKWELSGWVIITKGDGDDCGRQQPAGGLTDQVDWLGLRVGGHLEPGELSKRIWPSWQHHKNCRGIIIIIIFIPQVSSYIRIKIKTCRT